MRTRAILVIVLALSFESCTALPFFTSAWIDKKVEKISLGSSKQKIVSEFGSPNFFVVIEEHRQRIEILGYEIGNYWYHEPRLLILREGQLVYTTREYYDLLKYLHELKVIGHARFFDKRDDTNS